MKKATDIIFTVTMVIVIILAILLVGVRLFGLTPYTVLSGSMEPTYHVGSLIYVRKADVTELKEGAPVTYRMESGVVVTHRIIEVIVDDDDPTSVSYRTQGDANETPDGDPIHINQVIGTPVFTVPLLGFVAYFVQNPPGCYITIIILALLVIFAFLPDLFLKDTVKEEKAELEKMKKEADELLAQLNRKTDAADSAAPNDET